MHGGLAAGEDEPVERRVYVASFTDLEHLRAKLCHPAFVFNERPLQCQHSDSHLPRSAIST